MFSQLGVLPAARIIVAGSTHAGEEALLAEQFLRLRSRFPDLFLVIVPRHFERSREISRQLSARGLKHVLRTEITSQTRFAPGQLHCVVVNTTGELKFFYEQATIVFVGKSLTAKGGQNPIEPCALGKPTVFGPNMQNFSDVVCAFLAQEGVVQVRNAAELETTFASLLEDESRRDRLARQGHKVVQDNLGATERTVEMLVWHLSGGEIYVAPKS
jgi:3-deoxy-D-manno-octulosonic-acid transferase